MKQAHIIIHNNYVLMNAFFYFLINSTLSSNTFQFFFVVIIFLNLTLAFCGREGGRGEWRGGKKAQLNELLSGDGWRGGWGGGEWIFQCLHFIKNFVHFFWNIVGMISLCLCLSIIIVVWYAYLPPPPIFFILDFCFNLKWNIFCLFCSKYFFNWIND